MNFLELCQKCAVECGTASGSSIRTAMPTVDVTAGNLSRIVGWVADAWEDLQTKREDWEWMRSSSLLGQGVRFETVAGQASYPLGAGPGTVGVQDDAFGDWDRETFRLYTTSAGYAGEQYIAPIGFEEWRNGYMLGANRNVVSQPVAIAVGPDQSLCLGPPPAAGYTVVADFFRGPAPLKLDTDVPLGLPKRFHKLIIYYAMMKYAGYESAPEVFQRGKAEAAILYSQLLSVRAPRMSFGGPL